ncbi:MAG: fumarate hydratase [Dehalococcoidia bacterium]|nr:fumarate hydratase [Dehalococcoidia bacterium]
MKEIPASQIISAITGLCISANFELGEDVIEALKKAEQEEESPTGKEALRQLIENARIAREGSLPLCQDCGTAVVFLEIGQDVHITGGDLNAAIAEGVSKGYTEGYLRKSMVRQPFSARVNTEDNTPPIIHTEIVPGDKLKITVMCKGGGAENMSRLGMLTPGAGRQGIIDFIMKTVDDAGGKTCPPVIVGVGIGGTADMVMILAKKALLRPVGKPNPDPEVAELERELLKRINDLGIGPGGLGGRVTALAVHVETMPAHIASMPVAVNMQCHSARHKEVVL